LVGLALISLPFIILGWRVPRLWTIAVPVVFWLAFAWLEARGVLPGRTGPSSALLVGVIGAVFVVIGISIRITVRPRPA
jgi:hypothetical protein